MINALAVENPVVLTVDPFVQILLSLSLAFTMLSVAVGLKTNDFAFVRSHPVTMLIGFIAQVIALPLATLLLIKGLAISPGLGLGMLIVSCCPGGSMSNLITRIAGGDTAYSVSLTMLSSIFSAIFLPASILFWVSLHAPADALIEQVNIDRVAFVTRTSFILIVPLGLGLWISQKAPVLAAKLHLRFMPVAVAILVILIIVGILGNTEVLLTYGHIMVPLVILHNTAAFVIGALFGYTLIKDRKKSRALVFEVGIQNAGLGLLIVLTELGGYGEATILIGTWGIWHLVGGFALANSFKFWDRRRSNKT